MRILDSRLYRWAENATNFFLLTILWLLVSLPVITFFPATTAMFGVFRAWEEREGAGIVGPFFAALRERFLQSLLVGIVWAILGFILLVDVLATRRMAGGLALPLFIATLSISLFYLMLTLYIYPLLANARTSALGIIKNAFLLALSQPLLSLLATFGLLLCALGLWIFPALVIIFGSVIAYALNALFNRAVRNFPGAKPAEIVEGDEPDAGRAEDWAEESERAERDHPPGGR